MQRYKKVMSADTDYWDLMLVRPDGEWVRYADAQAEPARLTKERDEARAETAAVYEKAAQWHDNCVDEMKAQIAENDEYLRREGLTHSSANDYCRDSILSSRVAAKAILANK